MRILIDQWRPLVLVPILTLTIKFILTQTDLFVELKIFEEDLRGPCSNINGRDDDLETFDFINKFKLDSTDVRHPGVTKVRGSNRMQIAYRLDKEADLTLPTRYMIDKK